MTYSLLGRDGQGNPVHLAHDIRREGTFLLGASGQGKSTAFLQLVLEDIKHGHGVCVIDPHGELVDDILRHMDRRIEDIILLDITDEKYVASLNLFYCEDATNPFRVEDVTQRVLHILERIAEISPAKPQMNQYFLNITRTLIHNQNSSMLDIPRLLTDKTFREQRIHGIPLEQVQWFWHVFFANRMKSRKDDDISSVVNKLDPFYGILQPWVGQKTQPLNFQEIMNEQKILLVKLEARWGQVTSLLGNILIALLLDATYSRRSIERTKRKQFCIHLDECHRYSTLDFVTLLNEARKYGVAMTLGTQELEQVEPQIRATCETAGTIVVFHVGARNAKEIAPTFDCRPRLEGPPILRQIEAPVQEPITYMAQPSHAIPHRPAIQEFMHSYGLLLVEHAKQEEEDMRDYKREAIRYQHDLYNDRAIPLMAVDYPLTRYKQTLQLLNALFHRAMMAGKQGVTPDETWLPDAFVNLVTTGLLPGSGRYFDLLTQYRTSYGESSYLLIAEHAGGQDDRIQTLYQQIASLSETRENRLRPFQQQVTHTQDLLSLVYKRYLLEELNGIREHCVIVEREGNYYTAIREYPYGYEKDAPYSLNIARATKLLKMPQHLDLTMPYVFDRWEDAADFYCEQFSTLWCCPENTLCDKRWWERRTAPIRCTYEDARRQWETRIEYVPVWIPLSGIEAHWFTPRLLKAEVKRRLNVTSQPQEVQKQIWQAEQMVNWHAPISGKVRDGRVAIFTAENALREATVEANRIMETEKSIREQEVSLLISLREAEQAYAQAKEAVMLLLLKVVQGFAQYPIEAPTGQMEEVPTEIPSSEVERRIMNELINSLTKYWARVRTSQRKPGTKDEYEIQEYIVKTLMPNTGISNDALVQRIQEIQERNAAQGYLRLRCEVEAEIRARQQPLQKPPQPHPAKLKPPVAPADNAALPPKKRPKVV